MVNQSARRQRAWDRRRLAAHYLRQQPAGRRTQHQPMVLVAEIEPQPAWPGAFPMTGNISGKHGRAPSQGFASIASPSGKQGTRPRQRLLNLDRLGRRISAGKLHAGGEPNAALHQRLQKAEIPIKNGVIEHGVAARRQMQVTAPLDAERNGISGRTKHQIGPGPSATMTSRPRCCRCKAALTPTMPAPDTTTTSTLLRLRRAIRLPPGNHACATAKLWQHGSIVAVEMLN
jgi:hypothetical protein